MTVARHASVRPSLRPSLRPQLFLRDFQTRLYQIWYEHILDFGHSSDKFRFWVGQRSRSLQGQGWLLHFWLLCIYLFFQSSPNLVWNIFTLLPFITWPWGQGHSKVKGHISFFATVPIPFNRFSPNLVRYKCKALQLILWPWVCMTLRSRSPHCEDDTMFWLLCPHHEPIFIIRELIHV